MDELKQRTLDELSRASRSNETVAVVTWLNYEPPTTDGLDALGAVSDDRATDGANRLAPFLEGINVGSATDPHLTALGHSYGSLTTGIALRDHPNTGVDEVVVFGSPGLGVDSAAELHVPQDHSYNMGAPDDMVVNIGAAGHHGEAPFMMDDMAQLSTHGYTAPDGRYFDASSGHSEYLRAGDKYTTTEWSMANIIGGVNSGVDR
ncbi:MAG: alpha/beta hydrolase family protein [Actinomycetota bacterium]|nr:alpha/beta hydrolase family protein [Actinomycetota bacterium]